jgi:hypothetical protein
MEADGINLTEREVRPLKSILKRPNSPSRFNRSPSPTNSKQTFSINKLDSNETEEVAPTPKTRINIVKEGE